MIKDLSIEQEKALASKMYYGGGYTNKYENGGGIDWNAGPQDLQSSASTGNISGGTGAERKEARGLRGKGSGPDIMPSLGSGLGAAGAVISALDTNPDYDNADVAGSAVQFAKMGAAAGPIGAGVGALVGLGVGLIKKNKFQKEQKKIEQKKQQQEGFDSFMQDQEEFAGYAEGGVIKKGTKEYSKAYGSGNLANMVNMYGEKTAVFPDMDEITLTEDRNAPLNKTQSKEYTDFLINADSGAENLRQGNTVTPEQQEASDYLKKANPVEHNMRQGSQFSDMIEGFSQNIATSPLFVNQGVGNAVVKGAKAEYQALKSGVEGFQKAKHWYPRIKKGLETAYHGNKLAAMPGFVASGGQIGSDIIAGKSSAASAAKFGKVAINYYNPFKSIKGASTVANYTKNAGKDLAKAGVDVSKGNYAKAAIRAASTFAPSKGLRQYAMKVGKDYIPNLGYEKGGMTKGAYSHDTNPLKVVDKNGQDTGMELTGGEGVFDKPAMDKITKLLQGGRFDEVGSFVNNEMKTWKHK